MYIKWYSILYAILYRMYISISLYIYKSIDKEKPNSQMYVYNKLLTLIV